MSVVLDRQRYEALRYLAQREGTSLSLKARDLLRDALEAYEDLALTRIAEEREQTSDRARALVHREVWHSGGRSKSR